MSCCLDIDDDENIRARNGVVRKRLVNSDCDSRIGTYEAIDDELVLQNVGTYQHRRQGS